MKQEGQTVENFNFQLTILALGFIYMLSVFVPGFFPDDLARTDSLERHAIGALAATPLFFTFYLVWRRIKLLTGDEFQQLRLMRQMLFASIYAISFIAIKGFADSYAERPNHSSYLFGIWWWYAGWVYAALLNWREDE